MYRIMKELGLLTRSKG
ncbi:hypothetical protein, partial [Laceyella putida]